MRAYPLWLRTILFLILLFPASALPAEFVDHIIAAVNNEVITWSELQQTLGLNRAVGGGAADTVKVEAETLQGLINRRLLVQEARRLKFADVSEQDITAEVDAFKKRFPSEKAFSDFLAGMDMNVQRLSRMLGERLIVERFVRKKISLFVRVDRDDAQQYFDTHPAQFNGKQFQEVYKSIIALLAEQKTDQALAQYLSDLRSKADIRLNPLRLRDD